MDKEKSFDDIVHGEKVFFHELSPDNDNYYRTIEAIRIGAFVGKFSLEMPEVGLIGDIEVSSLNPIIELTPAQEHLLRVEEPKNAGQGRIL